MLPLSLLVLAVLDPYPALSKTLTQDTVWSGNVSLDQDVLVPEGVRLTIRPGTIVRVVASESTKTDPEFLSPLTEITVRGTLVGDGTKKAPVVFMLAGEKKASWAGIIIDGGRAFLRRAAISDAESGLTVINGSLELRSSQLTKNRYGLTVQGTDSRVRVVNGRITGNDYGTFLLTPKPIEIAGTVISDNRKMDSYISPQRGLQRNEPEFFSGLKKEKSRVYGDGVVLGTLFWQGRVLVNGIVRVPERSRLIIVPGTVVEFGRKDTNGDGIGENGLLIQGVIIAKGTREQPIVFRSAEKQRRMGDWDSISIMNSDGAQNLIEFCQIEDAYRGLHFHFSQVLVVDSVLKNNYRGIQFQESTVEIRGTGFYRNKSAFQARDSEIVFTGNVISGNYTGMNVFRDSISLKGNTIVDNEQEGIRVREGLPAVEENLLDGNRHGLMISDTVYGTFSRNLVTRNRESGISLRSTDTIEISGNVVQANGGNGMSIQDSSASITGNLVSDNRERGIGVQSFQGIISGNTVVKNGRYNLGIEGATDVVVSLNWWGRGDIGKTIYDKRIDPSRGAAQYTPMLDHAPPLSWPLKSVPVSAVWRGTVSVPERITVDPGAELVLAPGTRVLFATKSGMSVKGRIVARGESELPVVLTSVKGLGAGDWDEVLLDHAPGSVFSDCVFEFATWGLHSHFTDLRVEGCAFRNNVGGIRFTSGPIQVKHSLFEKNDVGIRAFRGNAVISGNVITNNTTGIFVREKGGGLTITGNNLDGNLNYNIRNGDFNDQDVNAKDNWWGDPFPQDKVYDARTEPGIGTIRYKPVAAKPYAIAFPPGITGMKQGK